MTTALVIGLLATPSSGANVGASVSSESSGAPVQLSAPGGGVPSGYSGAQRLGYPRVAGAGCLSARRALAFYRARFSYWNERRSVPSRVGRKPHGCADARYLSRLWAERASLARREFERWYERTYEKWRCIHEHEGAWNSDTGNGYWGGLQMDWGFQHTYGPEFIRRYGLANRWPVWAQLIAAERAFYGFAGFGGRGYSPWGTRGMCGL